MYWKKKLAVAASIFLCFISCSKIDPYNKPYMLEGFTGVVNIKPGIAGITAHSYDPAIFFFNGNKDGTEVVMYGPATKNFSLYDILPEDGDSRDLLRKQLKKKGVSDLDKLDFSGFRAHVDAEDGKKIHIYDFGDQSDGMKLFQWQVVGDGLIDGPDSHVTLKISTTIGILKEMLPETILKKLSAPDSDVSIAEFEDNDATVYLAGIEILGEALTIGY